MRFCFKRLYLVDLLGVRNLPLLDSFCEVFVFGDTRNGTYSYDHARMSNP